LTQVVRFGSEGGSGDAGIMDIAFWIEPTMLAGEGAFVRHLTTALRSEGQKVTFIAPQGLSLGDLPTLGARVLTYRWHRWEKLPVLQKLRLNAVARELNDVPPDLLVAWGSANAEMLGVASSIVPALPIVLWCWDTAELLSPAVRIPAVRHIIASSQTIAERVPESLKLPLTVVHPGVYCDETQACFDVEGQVPCLVSLDPLASRANYEALIRACKQMADEGWEFLLFAYDQGPAEYPIWRYAEKMGLLERMSFVPFQQNAEPLLLHGDLYIHILPSTRVQYRSLEAMGRGLAIVTCSNHGVDYLIDGQTCKVVGPQTPEAWREALTELIVDRPKAIALAQRGQQYVRERHSLGRTLEQFGSICRQVSGMAIPMGGR
jgi:glycosyltransferase involved in cell wall biosynthesis